MLSQPTGPPQPVSSLPASEVEVPIGSVSFRSLCSNRSSLSGADPVSGKARLTSARTGVLLLVAGCKGGSRT